MIPADTDFVATRLLEHLHKVQRVDGIDRLDADSRSRLRHRENVNNRDCEIVVNLTEHETHDFVWDTSAAMLKHLKKSQRRDVDLLSSIR